MLLFLILSIEFKHYFPISSSAKFYVNNLGVYPLFSKQGKVTLIFTGHILLFGPMFED